jgi:hypothetical protein
LGPLQVSAPGNNTTHAISGTSSPFNNGGGTCEVTDQRGVARPQLGACDIGAYELKPTFPFSGFFQSIDNLPTVNSVKAGQAIPVKFSLGGNHGSDIFAAGYPQSQAVACSAGTPLDDVEQTVTASASSLIYDASTDVYTYVWKTEKSWTGCRLFRIQLTDGTIKTAMFQFR